jgi:hypothetical protein
MGKREFIDAFAALLSSQADGRQGLDLQQLDALVRRDTAAALEGVEHYLHQAWSVQTYLQPAYMIAATLATATNDRSVVQRVVDQAQSMGAAHVLRRLTIVPPGQVPSENAPERIKAREWWQQQPHGATGVCDECSEPLVRGDGFLVAGRPRDLGGLLLNLGDDLLCRVCFERRLAGR